MLPEGGGSVYLTAGAWRFVPGTQDPAAVAWGYYKDMAAGPTVSGFGQLSISTSSSFNDTTQMYGAGYLEAALTQERIWSHTNNAMAWISSQFKGGVIPQNVKDFFATQDAWTRAQIASNSSDHWVGMGSILAQFDGMVAGYTALAPANETLTLFQLQSVGAIGDYIDLITALSPADRPQYDNMTDAELMTFVRKNNHCSALVKVTGDLSELYFAHVAWFIFQSMTRIFKHYNFALNQVAVAGRQMSFSSLVFAPAPRKKRPGKRMQRALTTTPTPRTPPKTVTPPTSAAWTTGTRCGRLALRCLRRQTTSSTTPFT